MPSMIKDFIRRRTLTHCVLDRSLSGRLKQLLWLHGLNRDRVRRQASTRDIDPATRTTIRGLTEHGIVLGAVPDFLSLDGIAALDAAEKAIRAKVASDEVQEVQSKGRKEDQHKDYMLHIANFDDPINGDHPLLHVALDGRLLRTVAAYMGMWPQLHAIGSWLNFPVNQDAKASQLWHRDPEDLKTVKVFIYLDDVGPKQGPFTFIKASHPWGADCNKAPRHQHPRRVLDHEMVDTFPPARWTECTGPARTMIIADTVGYHRGGHVVEGHRLLVTFTYTSGSPQKARRLALATEPTWERDAMQDYALKD